MTLAELAKLRARRVRPNDPIHLTDDESVYRVCDYLDIPVILVNFDGEHDFRPLHGLDVVCVANNPKRIDRIREVRPAWFTGMSPYGFKANLHGIKSWN
jgi:hypothetical protein